MSKQQGTVKFFNRQKGFGFIQPEDGSKDLFVHANNLEGGIQELADGQKVEFNVGEGRKGPEAVDVAPA